MKICVHVGIDVSVGKAFILYLLMFQNVLMFKGIYIVKYWFTGQYRRLFL